MINRLKSWLTANDSAEAINDNAIGNRGTGRSFTNERLGFGGQNDVVGSTEINRPRYFTNAQLESMYINTWVAAKVVDLIVDDVFGPGIIWGGEDESAVKKMEDTFEDMAVLSQISGAVKAARLYGSSIVVFAPDHGDFEAPLDVNDVREGDISHLLVLHKENLEIFQTYADPREKNYGKPYTYKWQVSSEGKLPIEDRASKNIPSQIIIHSSRCLRFDGIKPNTDIGWFFDTIGDDRRWGISVLTRVYDDLIQDLIMNAGGAELVNRASVPVIKTNDLRQVLSRGASGDMLTPEDYALQIKSNINNAKLIFIDREDEVGKLETNPTGVKDLIDNQTNRLAAIAGVPITRFRGESATGLSATGNGDARDWRISVESYRKASIDSEWNRMMTILARNVGLQEVPEWEWGKLGEMDSDEQAGIAKTMMETAVNLVNAEIIGVEEAREFLNQSELFELPDDWDPPEPQEIMSPPTDEQMRQQ